MRNPAAPHGDADASHRQLTRRELLVAAGAAAGAFTLAGAFAGDTLIARTGVPALNEVLSRIAPADPRFHSRPDLRIPGLSVATASGTLAPGPILLAPYNAPAGQQVGALIIDDSGEPFWEQPLAGLVTTNLRVQRHHRRAVLTWWEGVIEDGHGVGEYVIADDGYTPIMRVQAKNGLKGDLHEFLLTDRGTALLTAYAIRTMDLTAVGGSATGTIQDAIFQEIDLASGRLLLEWHSLDHIPITESYWPTGELWDYVHINSIDVADDGNLLVSSRNTHTVYKVDRSSGEIIWRLGGKHSDFTFGGDASFAWQHDARAHGAATLSLFDNEGSPGGAVQSRALILAIDERRRAATLRNAYRHPTPLQASSQGSVQMLGDGHVFVGWGAEPYVSEFSATGQLLFDAQLGRDYISYRAFRLPWNGRGIGRPALAARRSHSHVTVWASWNGDTRTQFWVVLAGERASALTPAAAGSRSGFETALTFPGSARHVAVRALDANGQTLAHSQTITV